MPKRDEIRWLHLSDFHTGKNDYGQRRLFRYILDHIRVRKPPDLVFITGDVAQSGQAEQYTQFGEEFLLPLIDILPKTSNIYLLPGNHDVDRTKQEFVTREVIRAKAPDFFDPTDEGLSKRRTITSRFSAFLNDEYIALANSVGPWIESTHGYFSHNAIIGDVNLGIVGINTAWFSEDEKDEGELTPGKEIVEAGLEAVANADFILVLGHHPLDWFHVGDRDPIRAMFGKRRVVYLHGHLHKSHSRMEDGAGYPFLTLQCGAAFQAREDEQWVNGLLWATLHTDEKRLELEPLHWNKANQEWALDGMAFPDRFRVEGAGLWAIPLSFQQAPHSPPVSSPAHPSYAPRIRLTHGWEVIDREYLGKVNREPEREVILSYFDGRIPNWGLALSPAIPRRAVVNELATKIQAASTSASPTLNIILGAGGEGKTTVLLQAVDEVLKSDERWRVIFRSGDVSELSKNVISQLMKDDHNWLIVSDDAEQIAESVYHNYLDLQRAGNAKVHFLLSSRHMDWRNTRIREPQWERLSGYAETELRGLTEEDAKKIVEAWSAFKEDGLGKLSGLTTSQAVQRLVDETRSEPFQEDGAFLGALLRVRIGEHLKSHVKSLLDRLEERPILKGENPNSLLHAFGYIAAMHSQNKLFLSKLILARVLKIPQGRLRSLVIWPLGEEAAADVAGEMVFTRHRAIAEASLEVLTNTTYYDFDVDDLFEELVVAAEELYQEGNYITNLAGWRYLSEHFFNIGEVALAIRLATALANVARTDSKYVVKLASLFRRAKQPQQALQVFHNAPRMHERGYFHEWAVSEGVCGNLAVSVCLDALALSDQVSNSPPSRTQAAMCLLGIIVACGMVYSASGQLVFLRGAAAAARLDSKLGHDDKSQERFQKIVAQIPPDERPDDLQRLDYVEAIKELADIFKTAYDQREHDLPAWTSSINELTFLKMLQIIQVE